jgi:serpin B
MNHGFPRMSVLLLILLTAGTQVSGPPVCSATDEGDEKMSPASLGQSINAFACDLYGEIGKTPGNAFFSPGSIAMALSMTAAGARGETQAEMLKTLHVGQETAALHDAEQKLLEAWNPPKGGFQLRMANRLWGQKGFRFLPGFLTLTREKYGAEFGQVDFRGHAEDARREINAWIERQTAEKIKDLLPQGSVSRLTTLVLANAVYFKGAWQSPFEKHATREEDFTVSASEKIKTPFMHQTAYFGYAENDALQLLQLPYKGGRLAMVVLLPRKDDGLTHLEKILQPETLHQVLSGMKYRNVRVALPKFKIETPTIELNHPLEKLGIRQAFTGEADFSGMSVEDKLFISGVYHKAFVDVNEEGTEAAAATGVVMARSAAPPPTPPPIFRADHPFVFFIRDVPNDTILFLGRVVRP